MKNNKLISIILILSLLSPMFAFDFQLSPNVQPISVAVTGLVDNPGFYKLTVLDRLSDAILAAEKEGVKLPATAIPTDKMQLQEKAVTAPDSTHKKNQAMRSITLIRDGKRTVYDLQSFLRIGDLAQNPILRDGDVILISPIQATVSISGAVFVPDEYEYRERDTLKNVLDLAKGFKPEADLSQVKIYRYRENMSDFEVMSHDLRAYKENPALLELEIKASDRIMVPVNALYRRSWVVQVSGHVNSPGTYMIDDKTTLYNVLQMVGGPTVKADLVNAVIINRAINQREDPEFDRLKELTLGSMTPLEYNYLRSKIRQLRGKYSISPAVAWESRGAKDNPILRDGDHLYVPELVDMVWVSGQVRNPGLVPYQEGKGWRYYIDAAGGYTNNRRWGGLRIIRASSGNWIKPTRNQVIRSGDIIFVPESTDRDIWTDVKDVLLLTSQVVTIIIGFRTLIR